MSRIWLLDANVLIALTARDHVHHAAALSWFHASKRVFATCPLTQCALVRFSMRFGVEKSAEAAWSLVKALEASPQHRFVPDDLTLAAVPNAHVVGHGQVNDAYLAALARRHGMRLATLDRGLAAVHADVAEQIGPPAGAS